MKDDVRVLKGNRRIVQPVFVRTLFALSLGLTLGSTAWARDALQSFGLATRANDASFLRRMPELGLNTQTRDDLRNNLLMVAIRDDGEALALGMLRQAAWQERAVIEHQNQLGETALMIAALKGSKSVLERLLELGAEANRPGWTALHYGATGGHVEALRLLLDKHAYVDAASPNGTTPLMMAARFNHQPAAAVLLKAGADPTLTNEAGLTARDYARDNQNGDLMFWLESEEMWFINKQLKNNSEAKSEKTLEQVVRESGGSVTFTGPVPVEPGKDVEVGGPIR